MLSFMFLQSVKIILFHGILFSPEMAVDILCKVIQSRNEFTLIQHHLI